MSDLDQVRQALALTLARTDEAQTKLDDTTQTVGTARAALQQATQGSSSDEIEQALAEYVAVSDALGQVRGLLRNAATQVMTYNAQL